MALLFLDGFEEYASQANMVETNTNQTIRWVSTTGSTISTTAKTAQNGITAKSITLNNDSIVLSVPAPTTIIFGFYVQYTAVNKTLCGVTQSTTATAAQFATGVRLGTNASGNWILTNNSTSAILGTSALTYPINAWYHVQVKYVFNTGTSGSIEVKIDDNTVLNVTGINSSGGATQINGIYLQSYAATGSTYFDDFYVCDGTGTINNDFLGPVGVYTLVPTGAGSSTQFTPSAGSNWSCVDEMSANTTDYVTTTAANQVDLYAMSDLPGALSPTSFAGVLVKSRTMRSGTNNAALQLGVRYSATTSYSSTLSVYTGTYIENTAVFETPPGGGSWDLTSINGLEAGLKSV